jgi:hypothetical protein
VVLALMENTFSEYKFKKIFYLGTAFVLLQGTFFHIHACPLSKSRIECALFILLEKDGKY